MGACSTKRIEEAGPEAPQIAAAIADRWPRRPTGYHRVTAAHGRLVTAAPLADAFAVAFHRWRAAEAPRVAAAAAAVALPDVLRAVVAAYLAPAEADLAALLFPIDGLSVGSLVGPVNILWDPCGELTGYLSCPCRLHYNEGPLRIITGNRCRFHTTIESLDDLPRMCRRLDFLDVAKCHDVARKLDELIDQRALALLGPAS